MFTKLCTTVEVWSLFQMTHFKCLSMYTILKYDISSLYRLEVFKPDTTHIVKHIFIHYWYLWYSTTMSNNDIKIWRRNNLCAFHGMNIPISFVSRNAWRPHRSIGLTGALPHHLYTRGINVGPLKFTKINDRFMIPLDDFKAPQIEFWYF